MKKWVMLIGLLLVVIVAGYLVLSFYAVRVIHAHLEKIMGPGVTVSEIKMFPTHLSLRTIRYEDPGTNRKLLEMREMRIYPSLHSFLNRSSEIREWRLLEPTFFIYRTPKGVFLGPWPTGDKEEEQKKGEKERRDQREKRSFGVQIHRFRVEDGTIDFEDHKTGGPPAHLRWHRLNLDLREIQYPLISHRCPLRVSAKMKGRMKEGSLFTEGWIDPKTLDLETSFKVREIELKVFEPYYRKRVSAEIESGYLDMTAKISLRKRNLDTPGELELIDLRVKEGEGTVLWIPAKTLVSLLKDRGNRIKIAFRVKGNMEDPQFNIQEKLLTRVAISLAESLGVPPKMVGEEVLGGSVKGTKGLMEGLKPLEELFLPRKEKKR